MNCIFFDPAVTSVTSQDTCLGALGDEIVQDNTVDRLKRRITKRWVAQRDGNVAVDEDVPLNPATTSVFRDINTAAAFPGPALNANEHVVTYRPVDGILDVNPPNVIAVERVGGIGLVISELLGAVIVKKTVLYATFAWPLTPFGLWHGRRFHAPLPDIMDDAVVNRHLSRALIRVDLETVPLDVPDGQVSNSNSRGIGDTDQFAMTAACAVENNPVPIA